jgi:hypothetical protein
MATLKLLKFEQATAECRVLYKVCSNLCTTRDT